MAKPTLAKPLLAEPPLAAQRPAGLGTSGRDFKPVVAQEQPALLGRNLDEPLSLILLEFSGRSGQGFWYCPRINPSKCPFFSNHGEDCQSESSVDQQVHCGNHPAGRRTTGGFAKVGLENSRASTWPAYVQRMHYVRTNMCLNVHAYRDACISGHFYACTDACVHFHLGACKCACAARSLVGVAAHAYASAQ